MPREQFKANLDTMIRKIKSGPRAKSVEEIFRPVEMGYRKRQQRLAEGIPLGANTYSDRAEIGARMNLQLN